VLIGQPQFDESPLGFSITSALKKAGSVVYQAHAIPTRAAVRALKNPRVQQAAVAAGQSYIQSDPRYAQYIDQARALLPPGAQPMPGPMPEPAPGGDEDMGPPAGGGHVQKGNMLTIGAIVGVGLLAFLLLRK
jgi:hypothetical protein